MASSFVFTGFGNLSQEDCRTDDDIMDAFSYGLDDFCISSLLLILLALNINVMFCLKVDSTNVHQTQKTRSKTPTTLELKWRKDSNTQTHGRSVLKGTVLLSLSSDVADVQKMAGVLCMIQFLVRLPLRLQRHEGTKQYSTYP